MKTVFESQAARNNFQMIRNQR